MPEDKLDLIIEILRQHDKRFEEVYRRFDRIEADAREDRRKLEKIYDMPCPYGGCRDAQIGRLYKVNCKQCFSSKKTSNY